MQPEMGELLGPTLQTSVLSLLTLIPEFSPSAPLKKKTAQPRKEKKHKKTASPGGQQQLTEERTRVPTWPNLPRPPMFTRRATEGLAKLEEGQQSLKEQFGLVERTVAQAPHAKPPTNHTLRLGDRTESPEPQPREERAGPAAWPAPSIQARRKPS